MPNPILLPAIEAFHAAEYDKAEKLFKQALESSPELSESHFFLGKIYFTLGKNDEAIKHLFKYVELNNQNKAETKNVAFAYDLLGQCHAAINDDAMALKFYTTATILDHSNESAWHNLGLHYVKQAANFSETLGQKLQLFQLALSCFRKALSICGETPMMLHSVASAYESFIDILQKAVEQSEFVQRTINDYFVLAINYYQRALAACKPEDTKFKSIITSNLTECLASYGHFFYRAKDYENARRFYSQTLDNDPQHPSALNQMGMSYCKENHFAEARIYFLKYLDASTEAQDLADGWLNIVYTYRAEDNLDEANAALSKAKALAPNDPDILEEEATLLKLTLADTAQTTETSEKETLQASTRAPQALFSHQAASQAPEQLTQAEPTQSNTKMSQFG